MRRDLIRGSDSKMKSISVFSISGSSYFSGNVDLHSGGSERQMKYIVDILAREKVQGTVMTANSVGRSSNRIENVSYVNLWRKDSGIKQSGNYRLGNGKYLALLLRTGTGQKNE